MQTFHYLALRGEICSGLGAAVGDFAIWLGMEVKTRTLCMGECPHHLHCDTSFI